MTVMCSASRRTRTTPQHGKFPVCVAELGRQGIFTMFSFKFVLIGGLLMNYWTYTHATECRYSNYDFSPLDGYPWIVETVNGTVKTTYKISLCKALSSIQRLEEPCQHGAAVCRSVGTDQVTAIGNFTPPLNVTENAEKGELWMVLKGAPCADSPATYTNTIINFKCGKTLGSPRLLDTYACDTYFEWHTSVLCKTPPSAKEVKCHVYDSEGYKRDLSPLIKQTGGYLVDSAGDRDFYINVCRDIKSNGSSPSCPAGVAACELVGGEARERGSPTGQLSVTQDNKLYLLYRSDQTQPGCDSPPTTSITFICPSRGGGREPLLTSDLGCHYSVEWVTEYACREEKLVSHTCTLTQSQHDIEFDLTPLRKLAHSEHPYVVNIKEGDMTYDYYLNVCGELGIKCPEESAGIPACQVNGDSFAKVLGRLDHQTLRYSDGELTLTYQAGDKCSNHFLRETVINFHCDRNAPSKGMGWPEFNHEDNCTYLFDWSTKYACLPHALPAQCHAKHEGHRFDLSALIREGRINWEALRSTHIAGDTDDDRYFLNVCHEVLKSGVAARCPTGSAICLKDKSDNYINLGEYMTSPVYDATSQTVQLHYTNGSQCQGNKQHESYIRLKCKPGDLESGPDLVRSSQDGCMHEFVWETAAACVLGVQQGTGCAVTDVGAGYSIDLSLLRKTGPNAFYNMTTPDNRYNFYINVCGPTTGSPCTANGKTDSAVCQVSTTNSEQVVSAGKASQTVSYYNGLVNLTYTDGDMYHSDPPRARTAQIAFLCQPDAGRGHPEFLHEANYTYSFRWLTSYVCPEVPVECVVTDPKSGQQYDLSSLARSAGQGNWVTSEPGSSTQRRFYLNVCRPVNPLSTGTDCHPHAAACTTHLDSSQTEVVGLANLGKAASGPTIEGDGQLLLTYKNGAPCTKSDGTKTNYTTKIHLSCQRGALNQGPRLRTTTEECTYIFLWETATACPLSGTGSGDMGSGPAGDCTVKDPNSEFVFDLKALRKAPEEVDYTVGTYTLNVCGPVHEAGCNAVGGREAAVCNSSHHVAGVSTDLHISDNGRLSLTYPGTRLSDGQRKDVLLQFECNQAVIAGPLRLTGTDPQTLEFTMETALACPPEPVACTLTDQEGREYDLSRLSRTEGNWEVVDPRSEHRDLTYYINVCHTLNPVPGSSCPGGAIGGCQVDRAGTAHNLGYVQSKPIAGRDGALSLRYLGGDVCHQGTPQEGRRRTRIIFECSESQQSPVLQSETSDCEYVFTWKTPSACPLQRVTGSSCSVTDPLYHITFDVSHLRKVGDHDYSVKAGEYTYLLNVCGPLNAGQGECSGDEIGSCQTKAQLGAELSTTNAGKANQNLRYDDGELTLTYKDGKGPCHNQYNRTTVMSFLCDHTTYGTAGPTFINESSDCTYLFEWRTSLACMSFQQADCTIRSDSGLHQYDLSPLTLTHDNYVYDRNGRRYLINVCTTLVHKKGATCPPNSAACYIDTEEKDSSKRFVKLGEPAGRLLTFDPHGNILLTYTRGQNCSTNPSRQHQTIITFVCKKEAIASSPTLVYAEDDCIFHFVWETRVACPMTDLTPTTNNCTARNPVTGYIYNMASLSKPEGYVTQDGHGHSLTFNICGPLSGSDCKDNPGACQTEVAGNNGPWSAGKANGELHLIDGDLFLNYSGGDLCHHNNLTRNTIINFVCAKNDTGRGQPVFVDEDDDCNYFLSWHTDLACEQQVRCEVEDDRGNVLDLSPLVRGLGSHLALTQDSTSDPGATYYINVCRPLNPIRGVLCPPHAAACRVKEGEKPKSLGRVSAVPFFDRYSRNVITDYDHGVPCDKNGGKTNSSSRISFVCKRGPSLGVPRLEMVTSDCLYMFEWETNVVCTETTPSVSTDCTFTDQRTQHLYDLTGLSKKAPATAGYKVKPKGSNSTFYINVCAPVVDGPAKTAGCGNAPVCLVNDKGEHTSYGLTSAQQFTMEGDALKVSYTGGSGGKKCESGKAAAFFLFECNAEIQGLGEPEIFSMSTLGCEVVFKWQTPLACKPVIKDCALAHDGAVYDLQLLSRDTRSWNLTDGHGNTFWLNLCQGLHDSPHSADCSPNAAACRRTAQGQVDTLGLVQTQHISMADDGKTIVVEYSQGSTDTCPQRRRRRRDDDRASVQLRLQCGDTVGQPVYVPRKGDKDSCAFEFTWKSRAACKEERVPVSEVQEGILIDPRSGGTINLNKLMRSEDYVVKTPDQKTEFYVNMQGAVRLGTAVSGCSGASSCQRVVGSTTGLNLGDLTSRKFYMEDDVVEVVFESQTSCQSDSTHKASTVIVFHCNKQLPNNTEPVFRDRSRSCVYLFDWYTPHVCVTPMINPSVFPIGDNKASNSHSNPGATVHPHTAGVVVGIVVALSVVVVLIAIFYKRERRHAFKRGIRRVFQRRHGGSLIKYSTLSSLDEDESLIPDNSSGTSASLPTPRLPTFDDDSDEDLIL